MALQHSATMERESTKPPSPPPPPALGPPSKSGENLLCSYQPDPMVMSPALTSSLPHSAQAKIKQILTSHRVVRHSYKSQCVTSSWHTASTGPSITMMSLFIHCCLACCVSVCHDYITGSACSVGQPDLTTMVMVAIKVWWLVQPRCVVAVVMVMVTMQL